MIDGLEEGAVAPELREEFPRLRLLSVAVEASDGRSSRGARRRLRELSSRFRGPQAVVLRQAAVPQAYRVFFHHIGLDPDVDRVPAEAAAVHRLVTGEFKGGGRVGDALLVPLVETGVPLWALDADRVAGKLELRAARPGEPVPEGRLVVADDERPVAVLFGDVVAERAVSRETARIRIFTVLVAGVPEIHAEEALATCLDLLTE